MDRRQKERRRIPKVISRRSHRSTDNRFVSAELQEIEKLDTAPKEHRVNLTCRRKLINQAGMLGRRLEDGRLDAQYPKLIKRIKEFKAEIAHMTEVIRSTERIKPNLSRAEFYAMGERECEAEVERLTKHSGVTDAMRGVPHEPDSWVYRAFMRGHKTAGRHLEAVPARCDNCLFYFNRPDKARQGSCQVNAPVSEGWPRVWESQWCGQHQADRQKV